MGRPGHQLCLSQEGDKLSQEGDEPKFFSRCQVSSQVPPDGPSGSTLDGVDFYGQLIVS